MTKEAKSPPKWILKAMVATKGFLYCISGGRIWNTMAGSPICLVTMTGRKTGRSLVRPLMYTPHGENVLIVASLGGAPQHPVWYHNIVAHPEVVIEVKSSKRKKRARIASATEKAELWPALVASYPPFESYQRSTDRDIPVFICEPTGA